MDVFARTAHQIHFAVEDRARITFEMNIHEAVRRLSDVLPIRMTAHAHQAVHHIARPEQTIDALQAVDDPFVGVQGENRVVVAVHEQQRAGRDQRRDPRPGPLKGVVKKHAVTVAVDDPIRHIGEQVGHATDRRRRFHPFIHRRDPKRGRPAAADPGHADPLRVHLGTTGQIVDAPNAVPALDAGGSVAARKPPPAAFAIGAMMHAGDFAQLQGVQGQAKVSVPGKPDAVRLVGGLVPIASARRMAADV